MCMLLRLLARFSLRGLQNVWNTDIKRAIETAADDNNEEVRQVFGFNFLLIDIFKCLFCRKLNVPCRN